MSKALQGHRTKVNQKTQKHSKDNIKYAKCEDNEYMCKVTVGLIIPSFFMSNNISNSCELTMTSLEQLSLLLFWWWCSNRRACTRSSRTHHWRHLSTTQGCRTLLPLMV